jgi:hypothetical protein
LALCALSLQAVAAQPTVTLTLSPSSGVPPYEVTLLWSSTGAVGCQASDGWAGPRATSGTLKTMVSDPVKFTLTCLAGDGVNTISWVPVTTRVDGSTLALGGYKLFRGQDPNNLSPVATLGAGASSYVHSGLAAGTYYYALQALDTNNLESDLSAKVSVVTKSSQATASAQATIGTVKPATPSGLTVTTTIAVQ